MSVKNLIKLANRIEEKLEAEPDPSVVLTEHKGVEPTSYMASGNLKNIILDASELLSLLNSKDELPQWTDESIAIAKHNLSKALGYVRSQKIKL
jgi:hypothetical protein